MSELAKRVLFAVPAAALLIWLTWLGDWYFKGLVITIGLFILHEVIRMLDNAASPVDFIFSYAIGLWVMLSHEIPFSLEIGFGVFLLFVGIQTFNTSTTALSELTTSLFAGMYAPVGMLCLILINSTGSNEEGFILTMVLLLMVWGSDIFAYFGGKAFGKHALAPDISPNKTWEGFFSGYIGSAVLSIGFIYLIPLSSPLTLVQLIPLVLLIGTFGPIGDLLESKLKRKAGIKDSSNILPGHGGFFDRFDALILAAPVTLIYIRILEATGNVSF